MLWPSALFGVATPVAGDLGSLFFEEAASFFLSFSSSVGLSFSMRRASSRALPSAWPNSFSFMASRFLF